MTLRDLRVFAQVAKTLSMSESATILGCAQPTVSHVIATIEEEYGVRLFERLSRRLYLTDDGSYLLSYAQGILSLYDEVDANLGSYALPVVLRMGATITVGSSIMGRLVSRFEEEHPLIRVEVYVDNTEAIEALLRESRLDLALVEGQVMHPSLVTEEVLPDSLVLVAATAFPIPSEVDLSDFEGLPFILREKGSGTRDLFMKLLKERGVSIREKWVCHSSDAILSAVLSGQGLTVISRRLVAPHLETGTMREVTIRGVSFARMFSLAFHKDKFFTPPLEQLVKDIRLLH
ncbi:MAG TPA: LysR family transcriptional regulator [Sphaerochaeta sp.]|nr:LysR family transcriptional regulator [Sphaerochaeta sp.]